MVIQYIQAGSITKIPIVGSELFRDLLHKDPFEKRLIIMD